MKKKIIPLVLAGCLSCTLLSVTPAKMNPKTVADIGRTDPLSILDV